MNPTVKKALSAVLVATLGAALVAIQQSVVPLTPVAVQATLVAALAGLAHYLDAWGHQDRVAAQMAAQASKRVSLPPLVSSMLSLLSVFVLTAGLAACLMLSGCAWLESVAWPIVKDCAPTPATLLTQVENILLDGQDVDGKLKEAGSELGADGLAEIICAVKEFEGKAGANTPAFAAAKARARGFLIKTGNES